jgi:hypothetical protein
VCEVFAFLGVPPIFFPPLDPLLKGAMPAPSRGDAMKVIASAREMFSGMMKCLLIRLMSNPGLAVSDLRAVRAASLSSPKSAGTGPFKN